MVSGFLAYMKMNPADRPIMTVDAPANPRFKGNEATELPGLHAFAFVGYNPGSGQITLRNPWNVAGWTYGSEFTMPFADFFRTFRFMAIERIP